MDTEGMQFFTAEELRDEVIFLRLEDTREARPEKGWVPAYHFSICRADGTKVGSCSLRVGFNEKTYIGGNIGYEVEEPFRGHHYAEHASRLLFILARKHGMDYVMITCDPGNGPSIRTCERLGGLYVETALIPKDHEMYSQGKREVRIYRFDLSMPECLEGEHIRLRRARMEDASSMLREVWGKEEVYRWMLYAPTFTEKDAQERCCRSMEFQREHLAWFIALKDTDEAIGLCAIGEAHPGHFEESGICLGTGYQGKGYGKEVVSLLLRVAFLMRHAKDFRYGFFRENERSRRLAEYFGFRRDATYELTRPWDGVVKTIDSCLLTREEYLSSLGKG